MCNAVEVEDVDPGSPGQQVLNDFLPGAGPAVPAVPDMRMADEQQPHHVEVRLLAICGKKRLPPSDRRTELPGQFDCELGEVEQRRTAKYRPTARNAPSISAGSGDPNRSVNGAPASSRVTR